MSKKDLIESLLNYVQEIKPYRTKVLEVTEEYKHSETIGVVVSDTMTNTVTRECNYNLDFYRPYDVIEAFTYYDDEDLNLSNVTIVQDNLIEGQSFVVAKVNACVTAGEVCEGAPWLLTSPPSEHPYVDFYIVNQVVSGANLSIGIIEYDPLWVNLPWISPTNNDQLIGYYSNDYGYRGNGEVYNNNIVVDTLLDTFTIGDGIRVLVNFDAAQVEFYKFNDPNWDLVTTTPIDAELTYCFAVSMSNVADGESSPALCNSITLVPPPPLPPPPSARALQTELQSQVVICSDTVVLTAFVQVENGAPAPTLVDVLWEELPSPSVTLINPTEPELQPGSTDLVQIYKTTIEYVTSSKNPRTFRVTFFDLTVYETSLLYDTAHYLIDQLVLPDSEVVAENISRLDTTGLGGAQLQQVSSVINAHVTNGEVDPLLITSRIRSYYSFDYTTPRNNSSEIQVSKTTLYKLASSNLEWEKVYQDETTEGDHIFLNVPAGTYRADPTYSRIDREESIEVASVSTITPELPDRVFGFNEEITGDTVNIDAFAQSHSARITPRWSVSSETVELPSDISHRMGAATTTNIGVKSVGVIENIALTTNSLSPSVRKYKFSNKQNFI